MRRWLVTLGVAALALLAAAAWLSAGDKKIGPDCTFNGKKLYGKVQFVSSFPDIKIKTVSAFPDLKVKMVTAFPDRCGEWQVVNSFPDLKIEFVESFPDITIEFVESFPGLP